MKLKSIFSKKQLEYIEAIVYIFAVIIVIFCKIYGPIYFNFIPLLIILGIVGNIVFKRGVVTTVFGSVVSICIVYTKGNMYWLENIVYSGIIALDIAMGELLGEYIFKSYKKMKENRKRKNKFSKKTVRLYFTTLLIIIFSILINNYTNGNIIEYNICKNTLDSYLEKNYLNINISDLISSSYSVGINNHFKFKVLDKDDGSIRSFKVYLKDKNNVVDEYKQLNIEENNNDEKRKIIEFLKSKGCYSKYQNLLIDIEYEKKEQFIIKVSNEVDELSSEQKENFAKQLVEFLNDIKKYEKYDSIDQIEMSIVNKNNKKDIVI